MKRLGIIVGLVFFVTLFVTQLFAQDIGRGLMGKPRLQMFDEPSLGLAPILVLEIFKTIKKINAEGTTILIVEQNVKQTLLVANRGYVLETGRIISQGTGQSLLNNDHVKTAYLGV